MQLPEKPSACVYQTDGKELRVNECFFFFSSNRHPQARRSLPITSCWFPSESSEPQIIYCGDRSVILLIAIFIMLSVLGKVSAVQWHPACDWQDRTEALQTGISDYVSRGRESPKNCMLFVSLCVSVFSVPALNKSRALVLSVCRQTSDQWVTGIPLSLKILIQFQYRRVVHRTWSSFMARYYKISWRNCC